ncbi:MAG: RHS repeat domain-containing protein [Thermoguttaceae bacterium]
MICISKPLKYKRRRAVCNNQRFPERTPVKFLGEAQRTITHVIGHQRIAQTIESATENVTHFFTFDGHGSTRAMLNFAGTIAQLYSFDAYENAIGFDPKAALTEFLYSGEQFDAKIGQQYLRARYYDPSTGRFNRLDPFFGNLSDPQSLHKYLYTHGDPVNGIDPTGHFVQTICVAAIQMGWQGITATAARACAPF